MTLKRLLKIARKLFQFQLLLLLILVVSIVGEVQAHYVETAKAMFAITIVCCIIFFIVIIAFITYRFRRNRKEVRM